MSTTMKKLTESLNIFARCNKLNVGLWSCPQFVFLVMGVVIILSILTTYSIAAHYAEPEVVIELVMFLTVFLLIITKIIVGAFEKVVYSRQSELSHAEEIIELKDQFVHIAIHDIASSATAIKWGMRMIEPELKDLSVENKDLFEEMKERNEKLIHLTGEILLITRIESERVDLSFSEVNIYALVSLAIENFQKNKMGSNIMFQLDSPNTPIFIVSDRSNLLEALRLLFHNIIKHENSEEMGTIKVELTESSDAIAIVIRSRGERTAEDRLHLFEKFWKDPSGKNIIGKGFGLYIVKRLLLLLGGEILFTTSDGNDVFTIRMPKKTRSPR